MPLNFVTLNKMNDAISDLYNAAATIVGLPADGMAIDDAAFLHRKVTSIQKATRELERAYDNIRQADARRSALG